MGQCMACDAALLKSNLTTYVLSWRFATSSYCPSRAFVECVHMYEVITWYALLQCVYCVEWESCFEFCPTSRPTSPV